MAAIISCPPGVSAERGNRDYRAVGSQTGGSGGISSTDLDQRGRASNSDSQDSNRELKNYLQCGVLLCVCAVIFLNFFVHVFYNFFLSAFLCVRVL